MPQQSTHPSREELNAYSLGELTEDKAVAIDSHISECRPCCETIAELSSDDTFVGLLKEARQLPTDQTVEQNGSQVKPSSLDVPTALAEHPRYEIVGLIGKGGMGDVYKATHRMMDRTVALKIIKRELMQNSQAVDRFHREVKAAAKLSHPNIVTSHDAEQVDDVHFMVMEYVDGFDLSHIIKDRGALPVAEACDYVRQAAIGLQHAHEQGMVHRDIKPHNLMVTDVEARPTVKILDFGLASLAPVTSPDADTVEAHGDLTAAGAIMGTPDFIAPEQADDARQADIRSDIYGLGTTLYFLLSGRPPFVEGSVTDKLKSHAEVEPEPLESLRDDIPADLAAIVSKMIAKDPANRFQTPEEAVAALESFARARQKETPEQSPGHQVQPSRLRNSSMKLTAVATLVVAAIVAAVVYYIQTNNGTVRVEVIDESLEVSINNQIITMKDGKKELEIGVGKQKLAVRLIGSDFKFETDSFEIRRNGEINFKVDRLEGRVVVIKDRVEFKSENVAENSRGNDNKGTNSAKKFSATALVNGCEITGTFTKEQAEITVKNPSRDAKDVTFYYQVVYQDSRERGDIFVIAGGKFESELPPGRSELKRVDILLDPNRGAPLGYVKDMLAIRVSQERPGHNDIPIVPGKKLDIAKQPATIATQATPGYSPAARPLEKLQDKLGPEFPFRVSPIQGKEESDPNTTKKETAATQIKLLEQALDLYKLKNGTYPSTKEGLKALVEQPANENRAKNWSGYFVANEKLPLDPWGNAFSYEFPGIRGGDRSKPNIWSLGPDGKFNTDDDVNNWDNKPAAKPSVVFGSAPFRFGGRTSSLEYSPDGKQLLSAGGQWGAALWDAQTGKLIQHFATNEWRAWTTADFSPDGGLIAIAGAHEAPAPIWDAETGKLVRSITKGGRAVRFAPDGKSVFTESSYKLSRFDVATGKKMPNFAGFREGNWMFATPRKGLLVAGTAADKLHVWDWKSGEEVATASEVAGGHHNAKDIVFTPDGESLVAFGKRHSRTVELREARTLRVKRTFKLNGSPRCLNISGDGRTLAVGVEYGWLHVLDLISGDEVNKWKVPHSEIDNLSAVALTPDGTRVATGFGHSPTVQIWDVETGKALFPPGPQTPMTLAEVLRTESGQSADDGASRAELAEKLSELAESERNGVSVEATALSDDGRYGVLALRDERVLVYDLENSKYLQTIPKTHSYVSSLPYHVALSPDGRLLAAGRDKEVKIRNVLTGRKVPAPKAENSVNGFAFSRDGDTLAVISQREVLLWGVKQEQVRRVIVDQEHGVQSIAFSPDGEILATGSNAFADVVVLWEIASGRRIRELNGARGGVTSLAFSHDGNKLYAGTGSSLIVGWDLEKALTTGSDGKSVAAPKGPRFQLHFVEPRHIEGVTGPGIKFDTGAKDPLVYMHIKPALVLQPSHVASIKMRSFSFAGSPCYSIDIELTDAARKELAAVVEGKGDHMRHVTYVVDGKRRGGWQRYEINVAKPGGIPEICRADTFCPMFTAGGKDEEEYVQQIVNALQPEESTSAPAPSEKATKTLTQEN